MWYGSGAVGEQLGRGAARSRRTAPRRSRAPVALPAMASPHWDLGTSTVAPGGVTGRPGARPPPLPAAPRASPHHPTLASIRRSMPRGCLFRHDHQPRPWTRRGRLIPHPPRSTSMAVEPIFVVSPGDTLYLGKTTSGKNRYATLEAGQPAGTRNGRRVSGIREPMIKSAKTCSLIAWGR
jgi:hypothetical protein